MFNSCSDDNCLWIIILLLIFCGGCGDSCGNNGSCGAGNGGCGCGGSNNSIWIILILLLVCGCGSGSGNSCIQNSCC